MNFEGDFKLESFNFGRGLNWVSPKLRVYRTEEAGLGVMSTSEIDANEVVVVYGGKIVTKDEFNELPVDLAYYYSQVGQDLLMGPPTVEDAGIAEMINHSCSPTIGFKGEITLVALRALEAGSSITFDYGTCFSIDDSTWDFACKCGSADCRGVVTGRDWALPELKRHLGSYYSPYLRALI